MKVKILAYIRAIASYVLRKVLLFALGAIVLVGLSFVVWKGFSWAALSARLVWTGIGMGLVAGFLVFGETVGGRNFGTTTYTAAQASVLIDWNIEIRQRIDQKFDYRIQIFLVGAVVLLVGILVDMATR